MIFPNVLHSVLNYMLMTHIYVWHGDLKELKLMVSNELIKVDEWTRLNKLSINYAKSM